MSTTNQQNATNADGHTAGHEKLVEHMSHDERQTAQAAARFGYGPLAHVSTGEDRLPAFGGEFQPGLYKPIVDRKIANPAPLGLCAFALTTFVLSAINMGARDIMVPNMVVAIAYGYGGLVQLLAGMWEMAVGNTFGATALSSYGGFWISFGIVLTPGGFGIQNAYVEEQNAAAFANAFGIYLMGWFIFTTLLVFCTLKSTVAFFLLFFTLDMAFLLLGIGYLFNDNGKAKTPVIKAGGFFGFLAAFLAWYNALAGIADDSNSFLIFPVIHFPWSARGKALRASTKSEHTA